MEWEGDNTYDYNTEYYNDEYYDYKNYYEEYNEYEEYYQDADHDYTNEYTTQDVATAQIVENQVVEAKSNEEEDDEEIPTDTQKRIDLILKGKLKGDCIDANGNNGIHIAVLHGTRGKCNIEDALSVIEKCIGEHTEWSTKGRLTVHNDAQTRRKFEILGQQNNHGETPVTLCAICGNIQIFKKLLERGATCEARDHQGRSLLMLASMSGNISVMRSIYQLEENQMKKKANCVLFYGCLTCGNCRRLEKKLLKMSCVGVKSKHKRIFQEWATSADEALQQAQMKMKVDAPSKPTRTRK